MNRFKGTRFPKDVILFVICSVRYAVSYRDLEEIMDERGVLTWVMDHATLNHRVILYSSSLALAAKKRKLLL